MVSNLLPAPLLAFVALFNKGNYWESHEVLEAEWRRTGSAFYHGLILYASAWVHSARGNAPGVAAQLAKSELVLRPFAPTYLGVDVRDLLAQAQRLRQGHPGEPRIFPDPSLIRGDEPELSPAD